MHSDEIEDAPAESQAVEELPVESNAVEEVPAAIEEQPANEPPISSKLYEAMERIAKAESRLMTLGVPLDHINEILAAMHDYGQARESIDEVREQQFYRDARALIAEIQADDEITRVVALFLRKFAEHIVVHTLDISKEVHRVEDIVDFIPVMSESEE